jgi:tetratricopeptide (TPR) repeat protein
MADAIDAVLVRAAQLTTSGRPHAAIELLRPALVVHPEHSGAWCRLSVAYLDAGAVDESLDAAKRAITLGERSWAHRLASLALIELGRHEEAVACAREAVRRDPADWRCHVALAEALGPTSPDEALEAAHRAVELASGEARPHEVLGDTAIGVRDLPLARRAFRDALRLEPANEHIKAKLDTLESHTRPVPVVPVRAEPPVPFERAQRIAVWLVVRRATGWLVTGSLALLIAGRPTTPAALLIWFGFGLAVFAVGLGVRGWFTLPPGAKVGLEVLRRAEPLVLVAVAVAAVSVLLLLVWTIGVSLGAPGIRLLAVVFTLSLVPNGLGWLGLWRLRPRTR